MLHVHMQILKKLSDSRAQRLARGTNAASAATTTE